MAAAVRSCGLPRPDLCGRTLTFMDLAHAINDARGPWDGSLTHTCRCSPTEGQLVTGTGTGPAMAASTRLPLRLHLYPRVSDRREGSQRHAPRHRRVNCGGQDSAAQTLRSDGRSRALSDPDQQRVRARHRRDVLERSLCRSAGATQRAWARSSPPHRTDCTPLSRHSPPS